MLRLIALVVLSTFIPMQIYAGESLDFDPVEQEYLTPPRASKPVPASPEPVTVEPVVPPAPAVQPVQTPAAVIAVPPEQQKIVKPPAEQLKPSDKELAERLKEAPPTSVAKEGSGTNWWLWGTLGVVLVGGAVAALALSGGGGSKNTTSNTAIPTGPPPSSSSTATVSGSW